MIDLSTSKIERAQGLVVTTGLLTFVCVGVAASLALVAAVFYFVVQFILILLQAIIETFSTIGGIWVSADPFTKLLILAALVYGAYKLYQWRFKGGVK